MFGGKDAAINAHLAVVLWQVPFGLINFFSGGCHQIGDGCEPI